MAQRYLGTTKTLEAKLMPVDQLVTAITGVNPPETTALPDLLQKRFAWFQDANKQEATRYLEGMQLASAQHLPQQLDHYKGQILTLVTKDMASRAQALAVTKLGYYGHTYYHAETLPLPKRSFTVCSTIGRSVYEWVYSSIEAFNRMIPPQALKARALLEREGIFPQGYWVADKFKLVTYTRRNVDPILSAQFGRFFVAIFDWI